MLFILIGRIPAKTLGIFGLRAIVAGGLCIFATGGLVQAQMATSPLEFYKVVLEHNANILLGAIGDLFLFIPGYCAILISLALVIAGGQRLRDLLPWRRFGKSMSLNSVPKPTKRFARFAAVSTLVTAGFDYVETSMVLVAYSATHPLSLLSGRGTITTIVNGEASTVAVPNPAGTSIAETADGVAGAATSEALADPKVIWVLRIAYYYKWIFLALVLIFLAVAVYYRFQRRSTPEGQLIT